jgi:hypothetical protein
MTVTIYDRKGLKPKVKASGPTVTLSSLEPIAADRIIGRITAGTGSPEVLSASQVKTILDLTGITAAVFNAKADLASPALAGTPTAPTATAGTNTTQISTTAFVQAAVANLVASSPAVLDTLNELAAALGNDANFAATMTTALAGKQATLGYTAENTDNKSVSVVTDQASNTKYPSVKSVYDWATGVFITSLAAAIDQVLTGFSAAAGTVSATDTVKQALQKIVGNLAAWRVPSGGSTGQVLTKTSATDNDVGWTTPSGGGGSLTNFVESVNTSSPNDSVPVVRLLASNAATDVDIALTPKGAGGISAQVADGTVTGGDKRGQYAVDFQMRRDASYQVASGFNSCIVGGHSNAVSGQQSFIGAGYYNSTDGVGTFIGAGVGNAIQSGTNFSGIVCGVNNSITNTYCCILGGTGNVASGSNSAMGGGSNNTASGDYSSIMGGIYNTASGGYSTIGGGYSNTASGSYSLASGAYGNTFSIQGRWAHGSGLGLGSGRSQKSLLVLSASTTDASVKVMTTDVAAGGTTNQLVLQNQQAMTFTGMVISKKLGATGAANIASWKIEGCIVRGANAAATELVASTVTAISNTPGWTLALTADTTNGALKVTFTGAAATNIYTVCTLESCEVIAS